MCGFVAIYNSKKIRKFTSDDLLRMTSLIEHRGPDNEDFFINPNIMMGHRRLSILDLSSEANQPMTMKNITLVFNGEIYNYIEIKEELKSVYGVKFRTNSDTEVIIRSYLQWGESCVNRFNGMFSFLIWDDQNKLLFFARDRLGVKPFYYLQAEDRSFFFASDIKSIWELHSPENNLDLKSIRSNLANGFFKSSETSTAHIHKVPPGSYGFCKDNNIIFTRYWDLTSVEERQIPFKDAVFQTESLLKDSIKLRLRSDVPLGTFLSGGIDSSLITAIASKEIEEPMNTFSIGLDDKKYDESKYAYQVAEKYNTNHNHIFLDHKSLESLPEVIWMFSDLYGDSSALPAYYVAKNAAEKLKVVFTGDGGDEMFGGYPIPYAVYLSHYYKTLPKYFRQQLQNITKNTDLKNIPRYLRWILRFNDLSLMSFDKINDSFCLNNVWEENRSLDHSDLFEGKTMTKKVLLAEINDRMINDYLVKVDMSTMAHSIEGRSPFLDYRIAELGLSLPDDIIFHKFGRKNILKKIAERYFDKKFIYRKKMGFSIPLAKWLSQPDYIKLLRMLSFESQLIKHLFSDDVIVSTINDFEQNPNHNANKIWSLLWLLIWEQLFILKSISRKTKLSELL